MQRIKNALKTGVFANIYLLYGPETYLIDYYAEQIIKKCVESGTEEFNLLKFTSEVPEEKAVDEFISSYPFMSDRKVLYIRNSGIIKKSSEQQKKYWSTALSEIPEYVTVIFSETETDKRNALYKQIAKSNSAYEFPYQDIRALSAWIAKIFAASQKSIDSRDAAYLAEICGPSMLNIKNEIDKLISYIGQSDTVAKNDIDAVAAKSTENRVFEMVDDIIAKRGNEAYKKLSDLKVLNEEPIKLISIIFNKFSTYKKLCSIKNRPIREICSLAGLYEKYAKIYLNQLRNLPESKIDSVMNMCMKMDFGIKSGKIEKWLAVDLIIAEAMKE